MVGVPNFRFIRTQRAGDSLGLVVDEYIIISSEKANRHEKVSGCYSYTDPSREYRPCVDFMCLYDALCQHKT